MRALVDGLPGDVLPVDDRGFLFGETVFETLAFHDGIAPLWDRHMARLAQAAGQLAITLPHPDVLLRECRQLVPDRGRAVARITLSAGSGGRGYWPAPNPKSRRVVQIRRWPDAVERHRREGLRLMISEQVLDSSALGQGIKHGNRLVQVAAARECAESGAEEALLLDEQGCVLEAISSNVILVLDDSMLTHPKPAVAGVGLGWLRDQPEVRMVEARVPATDLDRCSEILVINSVAGVRPVVAIDRQPFSAGPVCRRLQSLWNACLP